MINIGGIVAIVVFYLLILFVGIWAAKKKGNGGESEEEVMLAGRNIGLFVGIFTMTGIQFWGFCPSLSESVTKNEIVVKMIVRLCM